MIALLLILKPNKVRFKVISKIKTVLVYPHFDIVGHATLQVERNTDLNQVTKKGEGHEKAY